MPENEMTGRLNAPKVIDVLMSLFAEQYGVDIKYTLTKVEDEEVG